MTSAFPSPSPDTQGVGAASSAQRRCLVLGTVGPKESLVRFVLDPAGRIVPDVAGKLPGRGLWVSCQGGAIETAVRKKLFARSARQNVVVSPDLSAQVERLLARRCLDWMGLARGAGIVTLGEGPVLEACAARKLDLILLSGDAGADIRKKLSRARGLFVLDGLTQDELGAALGRGAAVAAGLCSHSLTEKLKIDIARWQGVRGGAGQGAQTQETTSQPED